jgi:hypothetical protein
LQFEKANNVQGVASLFMECLESNIPTMSEWMKKFKQIQESKPTGGLNRNRSLAFALNRNRGRRPKQQGFTPYRELAGHAKAVYDGMTEEAHNVYNKDTLRIVTNRGGTR